MKKFILISAALLIVSSETFAGDYLTNTNQNAAFLRMVARGASIDVDGAYSNPAGLSFLPENGFYFSLTGQSAFQERTINATTLWDLKKPSTKEFEGKASAPFIPSFQAAFKKGDWTISTNFAVIGGGGKASFDQGLPLFNSLITGMVAMHPFYKKIVSPSMYDINSAMDGKQYIFGLQLGLGYKVTDWLSVYAGGRMSYMSAGYEGFLNAQLKDDYRNPTTFPAIDKLPDDGSIARIGLNCDQKGWGISPVIGADFKFYKFNIGLKYEFKTNLNIENKTGDITIFGPDMIKDKMKDYEKGVNTPSDIPAMLSAAVGYEFLPSLRATVEYHFYDDKNAGMAKGREKALNHGTHEFLCGAEWDVTSQLTISGGYQNTNYGLSDNFQTDTSFYCDSYSIGLGARIKFNKAWSMDVGYFWTNYKDYTKTSEAYNGMMITTPEGKVIGIPGTDVYSRSNKTFGVSLNYKL